MTNRGRWVVTVAVGLVVAAPALLPDPEDDFPISTYPMFTTERGEVVDLDTAVLFDGGRVLELPERAGPMLKAGTPLRWRRARES